MTRIDRGEGEQGADGEYFRVSVVRVATAVALAAEGAVAARTVVVVVVLALQIVVDVVLRIVLLNIFFSHNEYFQRVQRW